VTLIFAVALATRNLELRMLTENDVIEAVVNHLKRNGYRIDQQRSTIERGIDIVATDKRSGQGLLIEAKGATSSKRALTDTVGNSHATKHEVMLLLHFIAPPGCVKSMLKNVRELRWPSQIMKPIRNWSKTSLVL
jgi:hypothetical protein